MMNGHRQSDGRIVPGKSPNKTEPTGAEGAEGRRPVKGNGLQSHMPRTQGRTEGMETAMGRIRGAVRRDKEEKLTSLYHHVYNVEHLREAYHGLKRHAAPGVDGKTWEEYGRNLEENLQGLSERLARGAYKALPVRRVYIPKPDGRQRPLGVPALEDKIVQWVVARMLTAIWEEEFLGFSYGFRPGRDPHNALDALSVGIERKRVKWVLDADIRGFYDSISHEWMLKFVEHRVGDRRVVRLIQKWLRAGVLEGGRWRRSEEGTLQGGLVSPVLANIYLHYAFDQWAQQWRKRSARGAVVMVRYADDFVVGFEHREDAEQFQGELADRLRKFELELHAEKTRLIEFGREAARNRGGRGEGKPETFDFLGFTHICGKTRKGGYTVLRQTMRKRMRAKLKAIKQELRLRLHARIPEVGGWLRMVLEGHFRYYGVPMNIRALNSFQHRVVWLWKRAIERRSEKGRITWERMRRLARKWLPNPRIYHPWPSQRLVVST
jgi:RNA-directed DNA polymerase